MKNLIYQNKLNLKIVGDWAIKAFMSFNGVINKNVATKMIFTETDNNEGGKAYTDYKTVSYIEFNLGCYGKVFTGKLNKWKRENKWTDEQLETNVITEIVMTVLHELSHLDQLYTGDVSIDESANEIRTNQWVIDNQEYIEKVLNHPIDNMLYLNLSQYVKLPYAVYESIWVEKELLL
jgi:hypothetical protein